MRTRALCLSSFAASLLFAAASCSDDLSPAAESQAKTPIDVANLQGEELEKYAYGCEYYAEDTSEKVETSASEAYCAYVAELAAKSLEAVGNKSLGSSDPLVGVIKVNTCGKYTQVDIYYDTEDKKPRNWRNGYANKCAWDVGNNVVMRFCAVPASLFKGIGKDYAVVLFHQELKGPIRKSKGTYDKLQVLRIVMDSEDRNTRREITITNWNLRMGRYEKRRGENSDIMPTRYLDNRDFRLFLQHFPARWNDGRLPYLGFEYAVFGSLHGENSENQGVIYVDDEDKHNANEFDVIEVEYRDEQFDAFKDWRGESWRFGGMYEGIVNVDKNTTFRISKATY